MNDLLREQAPIAAQAWAEIDAEAKRTLKTLLAARRLVDFEGPLGWTAASIPTGRAEKLSPPLQEGAVTRLRGVVPLTELRVPFEISRDELEAIGRGARDADLDPVRNAARAAGIAEDRAIFRGYEPAGIVGIFEASAAQSLSIPADYEDYPDVVAEATHRLRSEGVNGPVWHRARAALLHRTYSQHDARLSDHQSRAPVARWSDRLGAGGGRRSRDELARRRLRVDGRAGFFRRLSRSHEHVGAAVPARDVHLPRADAASVGSSYIPGCRCETRLTFHHSLLR
jgi:uncharacterized linocin/CFP29 family protein